jgi:hypothetical protein
MVGFFLSLSVSLETEYSSAFIITLWPGVVINSLVSYRMLKKKYFF